MKERPILFSAPMVRAILEGQKTATRRPVKGAAAKWLIDFTPEFVADSANALCPYGAPGDRLWVREAWQADAQVNAVAPRDLSQGEPIQYPANGVVRQTGCSIITPGKTRPSIHMPRWVSRILLEVTAVRVERLHDIDEDQVQAEGIGDHEFGCMQPYDQDGAPECDCCNISFEESFQRLWETINGADAWSANPWVWVIEFKRVKQ